MALPFDLYTRYYDLLYRDKDYAGEAAYVAQALRRRCPKVRRVLELGCGTGGHAEHLARMGFEVHGIDLSDSMLARAEARRASLPTELSERLSFSCGDARSVRVVPEQPFDAVIALFHVMSYQTVNADVAAVYRTAQVHLAPGGVFLFDYWNGAAVLSQKPEVRVRRLCAQGLEVTRVAEPVMHWDRNVCDVNYTLWVRAGGPQAPLHQVSEKHPMRYLFQPELALFEGDDWQDPEDRSWLQEQAPDAEAWAAMRVVSRR